MLKELENSNRSFLLCHQRTLRSLNSSMPWLISSTTRKGVSVTF